MGILIGRDRRGMGLLFEVGFHPRLAYHWSYLNLPFLMDALDGSFCYPILHRKVVGQNKKGKGQHKCKEVVEIQTTAMRGHSMASIFGQWHYVKGQKSLPAATR